jgi:hypothetical protein|tara:strand:- start:1677 stop:1952 length:276 start_codon:yes stop_codon:yes gene_type:complete
MNDNAMIRLKNKIQFLEQEIKMLQESKQQEINVKNSEVMLNKDLQSQIETLKIYVETLVKINDTFVKQISELRVRLKNIVLDVDYETTRDK